MDVLFKSIMPSLSRIPIYFRVWKMTAVNALQEAFINRWTNLLFLAGKSIRLGMSVVILLLIRNNVDSFAQYTTDQILIFFLTYQFLDTVAQVAYRGVYMFSHQVRTGEFDFLLMKPVSPLFRALTGKPDINDLIFLIPTVLISLYLSLQLQITWTISGVLWYLLLLLNAFLIVTAMHIFVLVVGILTTEVDGIIWMYRDLIRLGQFPVSVYLQPLRFLLFFIVPIGMMITIPAEVLMGLQPTFGIAIAIFVGLAFFVSSLVSWRWALKRYSSASS